MLNNTDKISAKTEQALIWNECTSKHLLLNSTTNVKNELYWEWVWGG